MYITSLSVTDLHIHYNIYFLLIILYTYTHIIYNSTLHYTTPYRNSASPTTTMMATLHTYARPTSLVYTVLQA